MKAVEIAKICHEANKAYCEAIGDPFMPHWGDAPEWQRASTEAGVAFLLENKNATPRDTHASWVECKVKDGWAYGPKKDAQKKEHPCMVDYDDLPAEQKMKDSIFLSIVRTLE